MKKEIKERNNLIAELHRLNTCRNSKYKRDKWKNIERRIKEIDNQKKMKKEIK